MSVLVPDVAGDAVVLALIQDGLGLGVVRVDIRDHLPVFLLRGPG